MNNTMTVTTKPLQIFNAIVLPVSILVMNDEDALIVIAT